MSPLRGGPPPPPPPSRDPLPPGLSPKAVRTGEPSAKAAPSRASPPPAAPHRRPRSGRRRRSPTRCVSPPPRWRRRRGCCGSGRAAVAGPRRCGVPSAASAGEAAGRERGAALLEPCRLRRLLLLGVSLPALPWRFPHGGKAAMRGRAGPGRRLPLRVVGREAGSAVGVSSRPRLCLRTALSTWRWWERESWGWPPPGSSSGGTPRSPLPCWRRRRS